MLRRGLKGRLQQGQPSGGGNSAARARIGLLPRCKTRTIGSILLFVTATVRLYSNKNSNLYPNSNNNANTIHPAQSQELSSSTNQLPEWYLKDTTDGNVSCADSLLATSKAVIADSSMKDPSISFRILLHPRTKDHYITRRIQNRGVYEPELEKFIARALPKRTVEVGETPTTSLRLWALDLGANVGFHSLHMAQRGANVISFEPAPDTAELFQCSAKLLEASAETKSGSIRVVQAGASNVESQAKLSRHPDSPGMTTFSNATTTFGLQELETTHQIRLLRPQDVLGFYKVPEGRSEFLRVLKVDVEGYELKALQGLNLTKFPFEFLTFEFFPQLLRASGTDPLDLLEYVREAGYQCDQDRRTRDELEAWLESIKSHVNVFCQLSSD